MAHPKPCPQRAKTRLTSLPTRRPCANTRLTNRCVLLGVPLEATPNTGLTNRRVLVGVPLCLWCIALRLLSPLFFVVGGSCAPSSLTRVQLFKALWIARKGPVYLIGGLLDTSACLGSIGCGSHAFPLSLSNAAVHTSETCGELLKKSRGRELGSSSVVIYLLFATSYRISPIRFSP